MKGNGKKMLACKLIILHTIQLDICRYIYIYVYVDIGMYDKLVQLAT